MADTAQFAGSESLERMLAGIRWRVLDGHRPTLAAGERLRLRAGVATLGYVVSGRVAASPAAGVVDMPAGAAIVSMGREHHTLRADTAAELVVSELELVSGAPPETDVIPDLLAVSAFADAEPTIAAVAGDMARDGCAVPRPANGTICALMATTVVLAAIRAWAEAGCAPTGWPARSADPFLARVLDAIHADPGRPWSVERLAAIGAMSRTVFADRFRAVTGRTPAAYLTAVRVDAAKTLLADGASVSDAARRLGYASDEGFSRAFRRSTGLAPSAWRARPVLEPA
ncbi:helix-turn-helix domain-containing protein [Microbacterium karelineae]|uniref:helix-turn-helix domain-containing protein n=1 Tax=Microbacterium karelineae TaxID=2654283 RepID=UPI0012E9C5AE|nr:AraC family transcriptional regulator [Microbacterium karelineae]